MYTYIYTHEYYEPNTWRMRPEGDFARACFNYPALFNSRWFICLSLNFITRNLALARARVISY